MPHLLPSNVGAAVRVGQRLLSEARFFNLDFPEAVFTWFSQACLIITFFVMLCRRWRNADAHLCGKLWAAGFFLWVQILLLGNALPLIDSGKLFFTQQFGRFSYITQGHAWHPEKWEAMIMIQVYGLLTLIMLWVMSGLVTPRYETIVNGWRRARKQGRTSLPVLADESNSTLWVLLMTVIGGVGWFLFAHMIIESRWYPGHFAPPEAGGWLLLAIITCGMLHHLVLEAKGPRVLFLAVIFIAIVPLMLAAIMMGTSDRLQPLAIWIGGISPLSLPVLTALRHLSISEMPWMIERAVPAIWLFWQSVHGLMLLLLTHSLHKTRKRVKANCAMQ
jgi:hypothetical protein